MEQNRQLQCRFRGMLSTLDTSIIFAYLALMLAIGLYASRGQNTVKDYFVAGGKLGTFSIAFLWLASWVGGAVIVGGAILSTLLAIIFLLPLALLTVIGWYVASAIDLAPVFSVDPLWPGLLVSIAVFTGIGLVTEAQK